MEDTLVKRVGWLFLLFPRLICLAVTTQAMQTMIFVKSDQMAACRKNSGDKARSKRRGFAKTEAACFCARSQGVPISGRRNGRGSSPPRSSESAQLPSAARRNTTVPNVNPGNSPGRSRQSARKSSWPFSKIRATPVSRAFARAPGARGSRCPYRPRQRAVGNQSAPSRPARRQPHAQAGADRRR